jgi:hypothetical protein
VSPLKTEIPVKNLGRQRCAEGFNSGVKGLLVFYTEKLRDHFAQKLEHKKCI